MAKQKYVITFNNGSSQAIQLPVGKYTFVSTNIPGYENEGTTMVEFEVTPESTVIPLTLSANGTLTVNVVDDLGTPITDGKILLCDENQTVSYGSAQSITEGAAVFEKMPYTATGIPFYLSQDGSDASHVPMDGTQAASMTEKEHAETILNDRKRFEVSFTVGDEIYGDIANYTGDLIVNG